MWVCRKTLTGLQVATIYRFGEIFTTLLEIKEWIISVLTLQIPHMVEYHSCGLHRAYMREL